jgi:hypothetical protein
MCGFPKMFEEPTVNRRHGNFQIHDYAIAG